MDMKCDRAGCEKEATTKGYIFGHITGTNEKDRPIPVIACDKHKKDKGFFEEGPIETK